MTREIKSNRAWREECEALREEVERLRELADAARAWETMYSNASGREYEEKGFGVRINLARAVRAIG